ncbi:MAG: nuclear transport factor 2 family protein [Myxococcota bacterium]
MSSDTRKVVLAAFDAFRTALRSKDWEPFLDCFTEDIEFWEPVPGEFNGRNVGKGKLREFYTSQGERLDLSIEDPLSLAVEGERAVLEYAETGTLDGRPFSNRVAISYVVRDGKIAVSREYLGDVAG